MKTKAGAAILLLWFVSVCRASAIAHARGASSLSSRWAGATPHAQVMFWLSAGLAAVLLTNSPRLEPWHREAG